MVHCRRARAARSAERRGCFKPLQSGAMVHWGIFERKIRRYYASFKPLQSGAMVHCDVYAIGGVTAAVFQTPSERGNGSLQQLFWW